MIELRQSRGDNCFLELNDAQPCTLLGVLRRIAREYDFNTRGLRAEACDVTEAINLRSCNRLQQTSPRQNDGQSVGDAAEFLGKNLKRLRDTDQVGDSSPGRLACCLPRRAQESLGVGVGCDE